MTSGEADVLVAVGGAPRATRDGSARGSERTARGVASSSERCLLGRRRGDRPAAASPGAETGIVASALSSQLGPSCVSFASAGTSSSDGGVGGGSDELGGAGASAVGG
jgi:hypothetical protein